MKLITRVTHMKNKRYLTIIPMALMLLGTVQIALAQDIAAGVKPGDQFTYTVTGSYSDNAPIEDVPEEVLSARASEYFTVTIVSVSGPQIFYDWSWHFNNGSAPISNSSMLNVETTESTGPFSLIVSANLTTDDWIHPHIGSRATFNETIMWTYTNYTRETNRWETQSIEQNSKTEVIKYRRVHRDTYFDKQTGMLVQFNENTDYQNPTFTTSIKWELIGQAWTFNSPGSYPLAPFFSVPVIIGLAVVVALVVVIAVTLVSNRIKKARQRALLKKK